LIRAYRILKTSYAGQAFTGEGARKFGGRWNSRGIPLVYCAENLSLATLELMVHLESLSDLERLYSWRAVEIPGRLIRTLTLAHCPPGWNAPVTQATSMRVGDAWALSKRSAVLKVPSVVTANEWNYLLNPLHPDFSKIKVGPVKPFRLDERLA